MKSDLNPQVKASGTVLFFLITAVFLFYSVTLFLDIKDACAVTLTKTFNFATGSEGWVGNDGADTTDSYQSDDGNPAGSLQSMITGGNKTNANAGWYISGITWESLGVPAGSTINSVDGKYDWRCSEYNRGDPDSASGNLFITDSADGNSTTLETRVTFSGTTSWATRNATGAVSIPVTLQASNTGIKIKLLGRLETRSSSGGSGPPTVTRRMDTVVLVINYTPTAAGATLTPAAAPYDDGYDNGSGGNTGDTTTTFRFKVVYASSNNLAPQPQYVRLCMGDNDNLTTDTYPCYDMTGEDTSDTNYADGKSYIFDAGLGAAEDIRFLFRARGSGEESDITLPASGYNIGPTVYLFYDLSMVGVPKCLGATCTEGGLYNSVLGDDSVYCVVWNSKGLDTVAGYSGSWDYCYGNVETGKGYFIIANAYNQRLDEPSGVGNVTAANFDVDLDPDGGWNMISNPYNANIQLQNVEVVRGATVKTFADAVSSGWIDNAIYEYEGPVTGYTFSALDDTPPAVLEPWVGYFIYVKDTTPTTLRVYKP